MRLFPSRADRRRLAGVRAEVLARMASAERDDAVRATARAREQRCLLGIASAMSGVLSRDAIRLAARRSSRLANYYGQLFTTPAAWEAFELDGTEHLSAAFAGGRGVILAPAHFGRYRWIDTALVERGYPVSLLVDEHNAIPYRRFIEAASQRANELSAGEGIEGRLPHWSLGGGLDIVSAAGQSALWELRLRLKAGRAVIMYPDGNSGMDDRPIDDDCLRLPFFGREIAVRSGIGALAAIADAPILPVFAEDRGDRPPLLRFEAPLRRAAGEKSKAFRVRAMTQLFARLEEEIRRRPQRWEEWHVLPRWGITVLKQIDANITPPPAKPLEAPNALDAEVLIDQQLALAHPFIWVIEVDGVPRICDLNRSLFGRATPLHLDLVAAAEAGQTVLDWMERQSDAKEAFAALCELIQMGFLRTSTPQSPTEI